MDITKKYAVVVWKCEFGSIL